MAIILGVAASLRNARHGRGSQVLIDEICELVDKDALISYLKHQTTLRSEDFFSAGRNEDKPFDEIYAALQRSKGDRGLSNSEAALVAALWGAQKEGADIRHVGLSRYYPKSGKSRDLDQLKQRILEADALIMGGPVYFGDRGSLAHEFIHFLQSDPELSAHCEGRLYSGVVAAAKRNGGQETSLIYQLIDMSNMNMLAVGNSSDTTAQYGGTVHAGDVGSAWQDDYGLATAIGVGTRMAKISRYMKEARKYVLKDKVKIGVWLVQDSEEGRGQRYIQKMIAECNEDVEFDFINVSREEVERCIACDLCPKEHKKHDEYSCIIGSKDDFFVKYHKRIVSVDAILLAAYSPVARDRYVSVYQRFFERTRYIRRNSYSISNRLVAPFVISELNSNQNLHIRMLTSLIRHHTILHHPVIGFEQNGAIINEDNMIHQFSLFCQKAQEIAVARLYGEMTDDAIIYNPMGYVISKSRNEHDQQNMEEIAQDLKNVNRLEER